MGPNATVLEVAASMTSTGCPIVAVVAANVGELGRAARQTAEPAAASSHTAGVWATSIFSMFGSGTAALTGTALRAIDVSSRTGLQDHHALGSQQNLRVATGVLDHMARAGSVRLVARAPGGAAGESEDGGGPVVPVWLTGAFPRPLRPRSPRPALGRTPPAPAIWP